jgi:hypothetical protein
MAGVLLAGGDDQRRLAGFGGHQHAHRIAEPAHRVQVDEADFSGRQRPAVGHADGGRLLQAEHVGYVGRVDECVHQRHFRGAGIAEDMRNTFVAEDIDEDVAGAGHAGLHAGCGKVGEMGRGRKGGGAEGARTGTGRKIQWARWRMVSRRPANRTCAKSSGQRAEPAAV